jgi:hypothetical protein
MDLPLEIIYHIISFLYIPDFYSLLTTSKYMGESCKNGIPNYRRSDLFSPVVIGNKILEKKIIAYLIGKYEDTAKLLKYSTTYLMNNILDDKYVILYILKERSKTENMCRTDVSSYALLSRVYCSYFLKDTEVIPGNLPEIHDAIHFTCNDIIGKLLLRNHNLRVFIMSNCSRECLHNLFPKIGEYTIESVSYIFAYFIARANKSEDLKVVINSCADDMSKYKILTAWSEIHRNSLNYVKEDIRNILMKNNNSICWDIILNTSLDSRFICDLISESSENNPGDMYHHNKLRLMIDKRHEYERDNSIGGAIKSALSTIPMYILSKIYS